MQDGIERQRAREIQLIHQRYTNLQRRHRPTAEMVDISDVHPTSITPSVALFLPFTRAPTPRPSPPAGALGSFPLGRLTRPTAPRNNSLPDQYPFPLIPSPSHILSQTQPRSRPQRLTSLLTTRHLTVPSFSPRPVKIDSRSARPPPPPNSQPPWAASTRSSNVSGPRLCFHTMSTKADCPIVLTHPVRRLLHNTSLQASSYHSPSFCRCHQSSTIPPPANLLSAPYHTPY